MTHSNRFLRRGSTVPLMLTASAFVGLVAVASLFGTNVPMAEMSIEPKEQLIATNDTFVIKVFVESVTPVNVFAGVVNFSHDVLAIESIDYNTSIANLWAETPWYSNGEGTLNFGGGTTKEGGFEGRGALIAITFKTLDEGEGVISLNDARILLHDGLGTYVTLNKPIDSIVTVENHETKNSSLVVPSDIVTTYKVVDELPSTDLNGDGKQSIADISIFMLHITSDDSRFDFNLDGEINIKDLNIILSSD